MACWKLEAVGYSVSRGHKLICRGFLPYKCNFVVYYTTNGWQLSNSDVLKRVFYFFSLPFVIGKYKQEKKTSFYLFFLFCFAFLCFLRQISMFVTSNSSSQSLRSRVKLCFRIFFNMVV